MQAGDYIRVGDVLAEKCRVERNLGRGGMGFVFAEWHEDLQQRRAVKFMFSEAAQSATAVERFLREAWSASRLTSPHAVKIYDVARMPDGVPYIVMEYLEGMDLDNILESRGPLVVGEACRYVLEACEAIEAHALGIMHRDLKPANLFVTPDFNGNPFVKVLDFGIAKVVRREEVQLPSFTADQATMGTPAFHSVDTGSDTYGESGSESIEWLPNSGTSRSASSQSDGAKEPT